MRCVPRASPHSSTPRRRRERSRLSRALEKEGHLTARAHFAVLIRPPEGRDPDKAVAFLKSMAQRYDQGELVPDPRMTVRNFKMFLDGVISAPALTGAMLAPYFVNRGTAPTPAVGSRQ